MSPRSQILCVDDDPSICRLLVRLLEGAGYEVVTAGDGVEAVEMATQGRPDLILLDLMLPKRNGLEVCAHLKAQEETAAIPIIFVTAASGADQILKGFSVGGSDYVVKPIKPQELLARASVHLRLRRAEREVRESEERFRSVVAASKDAMIAIGQDGLINLFNPAAEEMFGRSADEMLGEPLDCLMPEEYRAQHRQDVEAYFRHGKPDKAIGETVELPAVRSDGSQFLIELSLSAGRHGEQRFVLATIRDITGRKQAEVERLQLVKMEQERNHLRDAIRAQERMLGIVGHELRTPLAGVRAMAEFLLQEDARQTAELDEFLRGIRDEVIKMAGTVNDTLEVARMNSGRARWNWSEVPVAEACRQAIETVRLLVDQEKVKLGLEVTPADLAMKGDPGAVRRLVVNLLSNAHKHTSQGSISVRARTITKDDQPWVQVQVCDTGEGMPPEVASRLGEAFALNAGVVGENHVKGSGLGLAVCKGIVAAHGGTISVHTVSGKGTTVTVLMRPDLPEPARIDQAPKIACEVP